MFFVNKTQLSAASFPLRSKEHLYIEQTKYSQCLIRTKSNCRLYGYERTFFTVKCTIFLFSPSWLNATPSLSQDNKAGGEVKLLQYVFDFCFIFVFKVCFTLCTFFATLYIGVTLFSFSVQSVSVLCYSTMCSSFAIFCAIECICHRVCSFCFT